MIFDRTNTPWNNKISDRDIFNSTFCFGYLLETNNLPEFDPLNKLANSVYEVIAKFTYKGFNGDYIYCNGQKLVERKDKNAPITYGKNVELVDGIPLKASGSNKYPTVRFIDDWCVLKFKSYGLPIINQLNGWEMKIINLKII